MENYPDELIRGVTNSSELDDEGNATVNTFIFRDNLSRSDNKLELSIIWCDDYDKAFSIAMDQVKGDGSFQFKTGIVKLVRSRVDEMRKTPPIKGKLEYERAPIEGNEFHGNIICPSGLSKQTMNLIRASLVLSVNSTFLRTAT